MQLDVGTIFAAISLVAAALALGLSLFWLSNRNLTGVGLWAVGGAIVGIGTWGLALRGVIPDVLSITVANSAILAGLLLIWAGLRRFNGRQVPWGLVVAATLATAVSMFWLSAVRDDIVARVAVNAACLTAGYLLCAREFVPPRGQRITLTDGMGVVALLGLSAIYAFRFWQAFLYPESLPVARTSATDPVTLLAALTLSLLFVQALLLLANRRLREQMRHLAEQADHQRLRALESSRSKTEFLAMVSHEFRTPLNAIIGLSELGRTLPPSGAEGGRTREYFSLIHESGNTLLDLVNDLLNLSKVEVAKLHVTPEEVDLGAVMAAALRLVRQRADARGQILRVDLPGPPPACRADARALHHMLVNLLTNALKFTPDGGSVTLSALAVPGGASVTVADTGPGIPADQLPRLLQPFERLDNSYARSGEGTGLGLALVDALARLHGGHLTLDSRPGQGTTATIFLPTAAPAARPEEPPIAAA
ncbi:sensor histidine kinase [Rhodospirillum centenum]|uniref:histidine kinase n=1 Tax=Rhodospirillum centenum (strain ATCC 51521 / SW) TaxID=414684 RepID=B6IWJ7_RHOCS|nr:HAMP domain-containing sensor histidine kinase [Rhodospirillum centenum]ACJ00671.1 histidine protein kinase DivJ [Rhodospirillum centenum SW]